MAKSKAEMILQALRDGFAMLTWSIPTKDPFRMLVVTVVSKNTARVFENLAGRFRIALGGLAKAQPSRIKRCLKVAGLFRNRANTITRISRVITQESHRNARPILSMPIEEARRMLLQPLEFGPKTVDAVLFFCAGKPTIPVDTQAHRVSKRLGLGHANSDREFVRVFLQRAYTPRDYLAIRILPILHGRECCRSANPSCRQRSLGHVLIKTHVG